MICSVDHMRKLVINFSSCFNISDFIPKCGHFGEITLK